MTFPIVSIAVCRSGLRKKGPGQWSIMLCFERRAGFLMVDSLSTRKVAEKLARSFRRSIAAKPKTFPEDSVADQVLRLILQGMQGDDDA